MAASFLLAACGSQSSPGPAEVATAVTVTVQSPPTVTIRQGGINKPVQLPGPITVDANSLLELRLQQAEGTRPWTTPISSNSDVLSRVTTADNAGYLVARFKAERQGAAAIRAVYPCGPGMCAAAGFELDVVVGSTESGTMVFSAAVRGTSTPDQLTCIKAGSNYHSFSVLMEGTVVGKRYFFRLNAYPYSGPGLYSSVYRKPELLSSGIPPVPDALAAEAPTGYPAMGFLNFLPKSDSSFSTQNKTAASALVVYEDQTSGFLTAQLEQAGGQRLDIVGSFVCGPPFTP